MHSLKLSVMGCSRMLAAIGQCVSKGIALIHSDGIAKTGMMNPCTSTDHTYVVGLFRDRKMRGIRKLVPR